MKYFTKNEFKCKCCRTLPADVWMYVDDLVKNVLDPVREELGEPIVVNSGHRCDERNKLVGGAKNSQHLTGQAADVRAEHKGHKNMQDWKSTNLRIAQLIIKRGHFDQLILEDIGVGDLLPVWVHVSYNKRLNRGQVLKKVAGQVGYHELTAEEICKVLGEGFIKKRRLSYD